MKAALIAGVASLTVAAGLALAGGDVAGNDPITCNGRVATIVGTAGADVLEGTDGDDVIHALDGADRIFGRGGRDIICAGAGPDFVNAGSGADTVFGNGGNDRIKGGGGKDLVYGGNGRDVIFGNRSNDTLLGGEADDKLRGGDGDDLLDGGPGADNLLGGAGNDIETRDSDDVPPPSAPPPEPPPPPAIPDPHDYKVIADFDPDRNLTSRKARNAHRDWWIQYEHPERNFEDPPTEIFGPVNYPRSLGSFHYARDGSFFIGSIVDFIRTTGDPRALDELVHWSGELRKNLLDHDGRGYPYFQYHNPKGDNSWAYYDDTNFLDEQMLAGNIALMAWALHQNRDYSAEAGRQADFWFEYLDQNWVPKWLARTTVRQANPYVPDPALGLQNVTNWTTPDNPQHDDTLPAYDPSDPKWSNGGIEHLFPVREFAHPYVMSMYQYLVMGKYFAETGKPVVGSPNRTADDYLQEADTRHDWWYRQTTPRPDGSRDWWVRMTTQTEGLRTDFYSQYINIFINALHWQDYRRFASEAAMKEYAKVWYRGPNAGSNDVYNPGDTTSMRHFSDGTGGDADFVMLFSSLFACWDQTGELLRLNDAAIESPLRHKIHRDSGFHHGAHYNGILSCELMKAT